MTGTEDLGNTTAANGIRQALEKTQHVYENGVEAMRELGMTGKVRDTARGGVEMMSLTRSVTAVRKGAADGHGVGAAVGI